MKPLWLYAALGALLLASAFALRFARFEAFTHEPEEGVSEATPLEAEAPDAGAFDAGLQGEPTE
jgi:hypothetical protein